MCTIDVICLTVFIMMLFASVSSLELYPYGLSNGDVMFSQQEQTLSLSSPMLLFSKLRQELHLNPNGIVSVDATVRDGGIFIPHNTTMLAAYSMDFDLNLGGKIYFRESFNEEVLLRATENIGRAHVYNFFATQCIIVTYVDMTSHNVTGSNTFQLVMASNRYDTYAILNYKQIDSQHGLVGFTELFCDWRIFSSYDQSLNLASTSNIDQPGVHVFSLTTKNCSRVELYPHGLSQGDTKMQEGDNYAEILILKKPMFLFSSSSNHIYISTNGLLSVNNSVTSSVTFPYHRTVLAPYHVNLNTLKGGSIFYRETYDEEILKRADSDVSKSDIVDFTATQAIIVTYMDVRHDNSTIDKHTFQVILASNGSLTYGIFNYQHLDRAYAVTGVSEELCYVRRLSEYYEDDPSKSYHLVDGSNIGIQGRFVFPLTSTNCDSREIFQSDVPTDLEITRLGYDFVEIKWNHFPSAANISIRTYSYHYVVVITSHGDWLSKSFQLSSSYARIEELEQKKIYQIELYTQRSQLIFLAGLAVTLKRVTPVLYEPVYDVKVTQIGSQGLFQWVTPASLLQDYVGAKIDIKHVYEELGELVTSIESTSVCDKQYVFNGTVGSKHQLEATPVIDDLSGPSQNETHTFTDENTESDDTQEIIIIIVSSISAVLVVALIAIFVWYQKMQNRRMNAFLLTRGVTKLDPDKAILEQCSNLSYDMKFEFPRKKLILIRVLGEGAFGQVWMATAEGIDNFKPRQARKARSIFKRLLPTKNKKSIVAVKALKGNATESEYKDLANELKLLIHLGEHRNVVNILGACTRSNTLLVILEYCAKGALLNHLRLNRDDFEPTWQRQDEGNLSLYDITWISVQIADGMDFLETRKCVHRDLAARNILIGDDMNVKIADFGLARDTDEKSFYLKESDGLLPIKWMAPEAITDQMYTSKSDSWSFGVLLWEIFTLGSSPYSGIKNANIIEYLKTGKRMGKPKFCPSDVYDIMLQCWSAPQDMRPCFIDVRNKLDRILITNEKSFFGGQSMARVYNLGPAPNNDSDGVGDGLSPFAFMESDEAVTHMNIIENLDTKKKKGQVLNESNENDYAGTRSSNGEELEYIALKATENEEEEGEGETYFSFEIDQESNEQKKGNGEKEGEEETYFSFEIDQESNEQKKENGDEYVNFEAGEEEGEEEDNGNNKHKRMPTEICDQKYGEGESSYANSAEISSIKSSEVGSGDGKSRGGGITNENKDATMNGDDGGSEIMSTGKCKDLDDGVNVSEEHTINMQQDSHDVGDALAAQENIVSQNNEEAISENLTEEMRRSSASRENEDANDEISTKEITRSDEGRENVKNKATIYNSM